MVVLKRSLLALVFACGLAAVFGILLAGSPARATTYYWTTTAGTMAAGSGTWDTGGAAFWSKSTTGDATLSNWSTTGTDTAEFSTGSGTVAVNNAQSVGGVNFDAGTNYMLNGGTLNLTNLNGDNINVGAGSAAINSAMLGPGGLNMLGPGALTLNGNLSFAGSLVVSAGTLTLSANNAYSGGTTISQGVLASAPAGPTNNPFGSGPIALNGGTLRLAVSLGGATAGQQPLAVTGFNVDDICEASAPSPNVANNFELNGWSFYEQGAPNANTAEGQQGLPNWAATGGTLSSVYTQPNGTHTVFQLQPYGTTAGSATTLSHNVAAVGNGGSLTLTMKTPAAFNALQLLYAGQDNGNYNLTLNFADGTTYSYNANPYGYWVGTPANAACEDVGLISSNAAAWSSGAFYSNFAGQVSLVENDFTVPAADQSKAVASVTFQIASGNGMMLFGLAGNVAAAAPNNAYANALNVTANSTIDLQPAGSTSPVGGAIVGPLSVGGAILSITGASGASLTTGAVTISGSATFAPAAGITLTLGALGDNGVAQTITKSNGGALALACPASSLAAGTQFNITGGSVATNGANAFGTLTNVNVAAGAVLNVNANQSVALLSDSGSVVLANGAALTAGAGGSSTFGGTISGSGSLVKAGGGALVLAGYDAYGGGTTLNAGTLAVNGQLINSAVSVAGGVLSGTGTVGNLIHVAGGGALAPGYGGTGGTLSAGNFTLDSGGILNYILAAAPGNNSYLNVGSGAVVLPGGGATLNVVAGSLGVGSYPLIGYGSLNLAPGNAFSIVNLPGNVAAAGDVVQLHHGRQRDRPRDHGRDQWAVGRQQRRDVEHSNQLVRQQRPRGNPQDTAVFGTVLTSGTACVALDASRSLSSLGFSTTGANSYVISASNGSVLTLAGTGGAATLSDSGGNHTIAAPIMLGGNLSVTAAAGSELTVSGAIGESYPGTALSLSGGGMLVLSGVNAYSGPTTIAAGTLQIGSAAALQNSTAVLSGGCLDLHGLNATLGGLSGAGNLPIAAGTLSVGNNAAGTTYSGNLSGGGAFAKIGGGTLVLTGGGNAYAGGTTVSNGVLQIGDGAANPGSLPGNVVINSSTPGALTFNTPAGMSLTHSGNVSGAGGLTAAGGGAVILTGSSSYTGPTVIAAGTLQFSGVASQTLGGNISGAGALAVSAGTLALAGNNAYTGGTALLGGVLSVASFGSNLPNPSSPYSSADPLNLTGGTLLYTGSGSDFTNADIYISSNSAAIDVQNPGANVTLVNAGGASFTKTGSGTLTLPGGGYTNSKGLGVSVQQGTVVLASPNSGSGGGHAVTAVGGVSPGATLQMASMPGGDPGGAQIYAGVSNMNGTLDLNGMSEGLTTLDGSGTATNNAISTTSVLTFGYVPSGNTGGSERLRRHDCRRPRDHGPCRQRRRSPCPDGDEQRLQRRHDHLQWRVANRQRLDQPRLPARQCRHRQRDARRVDLQHARRHELRLQWKHQRQRRRRSDQVRARDGCPLRQQLLQRQHPRQRRNAERRQSPGPARQHRRHEHGHPDLCGLGGDARRARRRRQREFGQRRRLDRQRQRQHDVFRRSPRRKRPDQSRRRRPQPCGLEHVPGANRH